MKKKIVINVSKNLDESDGEEAKEESKAAIFYKKRESEVPSRVGTADQEAHVIGNQNGRKKRDMRSRSKGRAASGSRNNQGK